ncbi:hypothetical protein MMC22_009208 [Lobaria immixta]|nr:hypothetical protein [Lobaria immixta]
MELLLFGRGKYLNTRCPPSLLVTGFSKAKSVYYVNSKKVEVYAQEASQIIGMIHQREGNARKLGPNARIHEDYPPDHTLHSISQHFVWVIVARYDPKYYRFLRTGHVIDDTFLVLNEYGPYKLTDYKRFQQLSELLLALLLYLENADLSLT